MAIECLVITLILGAIVFSFARADRIRWVLATIPLGILPFVNCVASFVCTSFLGYELPNNVCRYDTSSCGYGVVCMDRYRFRFPAHQPHENSVYMRRHRLQRSSWAYTAQLLYESVIQKKLRRRVL